MKVEIAAKALAFLSPTWVLYVARRDRPRLALSQHPDALSHRPTAKPRRDQLPTLGIDGGVFLAPEVDLGRSVVVEPRALACGQTWEGHVLICAGKPSSLVGKK